MTAGFVTFCDSAYMPQAQVLVESLYRFSRYPVELMSINCPCPFTSPNLIVRRVELDLDSISGDICYAKLIAARDTQFDCAVFLDADVVANMNVDELVELSIGIRIDYPLCSGHGNDPKNCADVMEISGVLNPSMPYVQANFLFGSSTREFFQECIDLVELLKSSNVVAKNSDESLINVLLWKHKADRQLPSFIPYAGSSEDYFTGNTNYHNGYYSSVGPTFHTFHGEKEPEKARALLKRLGDQCVYEFYSDLVKSRKLQLRQFQT